MAHDTAHGDRGGTLAVEKRSIDYIPPGERHGRVWHQGPFWFTGNFVLVTMVTGFVGPSLGLGLGWSVLAIVFGACFGTFFMAFHANQGPRMGLPQMIQSRAQFGTRGAIFPFAAVVFVYVGFIVFDTVLATQALRTVLPGATWLWYPVLVAVAIVLAVVGHDLLHFVQRWLTYLLIVVFGVLTVWAIVHLHGQPVIAGHGMSWTAFLVQFSAAAGYQISYAVYVSDYSRYLPENTRSGGVIWWTYLGAAGSAVWLMSLGALLAGRLPHPDAIGSVRQVGNDLFSGFGTFVVLISVPALVSIMAVNAYGAMLTSVSGIDGFRPVRATVKARVIGVVAVSVIAYVATLAIPDDYLSSFNDFVLLMLYFLVPWTAVNLVDFYFVRHGRYAITEIFNPDGLYGRWAWRGLVAYWAGLAAMVPFFATTFYTGPIAAAIGGADVSFLVGLVVSGGLYYLFSSRVDRAGELAVVRSSRERLGAALPADGPAGG
ncbi:transporter membrane subunit [Microtetraspora sp. NBRC 13810]|uniref:purine-cytosine permease family protein n=1 Tax=Microtetraspora sp. NBRC 13810 TaxID=3030990 RepID=UPI0025573D85|nr:cytosine permease [Microtetraspora sp. NBRC 13810]GLW10177.1 transporter membrane subunit [Microtetraspora sp. NBRC 13810]